MRGGGSRDFTGGNLGAPGAFDCIGGLKPNVGTVGWVDGPCDAWAPPNPGGGATNPLLGNACKDPVAGALPKPNAVLATEGGANGKGPADVEGLMGAN